MVDRDTVSLMCYVFDFTELYFCFVWLFTYLSLSEHQLQSTEEKLQGVRHR